MASEGETIAEDVLDLLLDRVNDAIGGLPAVVAEGIVNLVETIAKAQSPSDALAMATQNALADAEDAGAALTADALIKKS